MERIFENDFFILSKEDLKIFINVKKEGYDITLFSKEVLSKFARIKITKFAGLSGAIKNVIKTPIEIGEFGEIIEVKIDSNAIEVTGEVKISNEEFLTTDIELMYINIRKQIGELNVIYGVLPKDELRIDVNLPFVIARGTPAINGGDAVIRMYEIMDIKPTIESEGGVDYYELNVINKIEIDGWLGERIEPTKGIDGINVHGQLICAHAGKQINLKYDKSTVREKISEDESITTLRAITTGAVVYINGAVSVQNAIEVDGDIGVSTGNIDFEGFIDINGTVEDNYSVVADENIQILGDMGIGAIELIESRNGDIFIKGGIAGKGKAVIKASGSIYIKFASDCTIICENTVNIGFYAMNCNIIAKEVIFESTGSRLIGGETEADVKVVVGEIGSKTGAQTKIKINGFDKQQMKNEYDDIYKAIDLFKLKINEYKDSYERLIAKNSDDTSQSDIDLAYDKMMYYKEKLKKLYITQKHVMSYMKTKGEGEVTAKNKIYSNVNISIKNYVISVDQDISLAKTYYLDKDEIVEE